MADLWYVEDERGRRGPYSQRMIRSLRASYAISPRATIRNEAGDSQAIDDFLPEFKTGPLPTSTVSLAESTEPVRYVSVSTLIPTVVAEARQGPFVDPPVALRLEQGPDVPALPTVVENTQQGPFIDPPVAMPQPQQPIGAEVPRETLPPAERWYVEDERGRRGPYSRRMIRSLRASYDIAPSAIVSSEAGDSQAIDDFLPEFKTGPLRTKPAASADRISVVPRQSEHSPAPVVIVNEEEDLPPIIYPPPRLPDRPRFQFSLRTILLIFLIVSPVLAVVSRDIAISRKEERIASRWRAIGGTVTYTSSGWFRKHVSSLCLDKPPTGPICDGLDQLSKLTSIHLKSRVSQAQFDEIAKVKNLTILHLEAGFTDSQVLNITKLENLQVLTLGYPEACKTIRRLRFHPNLCYLYDLSNYSAQSLNDRLTILHDIHWPDARRPYDPISDTRTEYGEALWYTLANMQPRVLPENRQLFNIAVLGDDSRVDLFDALTDGFTIHESTTARVCFVIRDEAMYLISTPLADDLETASRLCWMADRVLLAKSPTSVDWQRTTELCWLGSVQQVPSWVIVHPGMEAANPQVREDVGARIATLQDQVEAPVAMYAGSCTSNDVWQAVAQDISLRPPFERAPAKSTVLFRIRGTVTMPMVLTTSSKEGIETEVWGPSFIKGKLSNDPSSTASVMHVSYPGDCPSFTKVAVIRDNHVIAIGTFQQGTPKP